MPLGALHALLNSARRRAALGGICLTLLGACTTPPFEPGDQPLSHAFDQPERSTLARLVPGPEAAAQVSNLRLLITGQEAFAARGALAELAEHTLDLQYHLIAHDGAATLLLQRLLRAAQRGVRVRLWSTTSTRTCPNPTWRRCRCTRTCRCGCSTPSARAASCRACWS